MTPSEIAARLPAPDVLERLTLSMAALDAVLSPDWEARVFSFDVEWSDDERMGSMDDGSGSSYNIVFADAGTVLRAFDHESPLSPWGNDEGRLAPGILDGFPDHLRSVIDEPAFGTEDGPEIELTFCAWHLPDGDGWVVGALDDDGGASVLLAEILDGTPAGYRRYATGYFEVEVDLATIAAFYALQPADPALLERVDPDVEADDVLDELADMGYPLADDED